MSDRECQPEQSFSCPVDVSEVNAMRLGEREQMLKDSLRVFMGRFADQDGGYEWTRHGDFSLLNTRHGSGTV